MQHHEDSNQCVREVRQPEIETKADDERHAGENQDVLEPPVVREDRVDRRPDPDGEEEREQDEVIAAEAALRRECCGAFSRRVHGAES